MKTKLFPSPSVLSIRPETFILTGGLAVDSPGGMLKCPGPLTVNRGAEAGTGLARSNK